MLKPGGGGVGSGEWGVGCGVWGVGCGVWGVGCGVWDMGCGGIKNKWTVNGAEQITIFREEATSTLAGFHAGPLSWSGWRNLECCFFSVDEGKPDNWEKTLGARREPIENLSTEDLSHGSQNFSSLACITPFLLKMLSCKC